MLRNRLHAIAPSAANVLHPDATTTSGSAFDNALAMPGVTG